jgi:hypothetical protein
MPQVTAVDDRFGTYNTICPGRMTWMTYSAPTG